MTSFIARRVIQRLKTGPAPRLCQGTNGHAHPLLSTRLGRKPPAISLGGVRGNGDEAGKQEAMRGLPEYRQPLVEEDSIPQTEEELARRRAAALRRWLENEMGEERATLTALLAKHGVKMRGGPEEAKAFVEELLQWKAEGVVSSVRSGGKEGTSS